MGELLGIPDVMMGRSAYAEDCSKIRIVGTMQRLSRARNKAGFMAARRKLRGEELGFVVPIDRDNGRYRCKKISLRELFIKCIWCARRYVARD